MSEGDRGCVKTLLHGIIGASSHPYRDRWKSVGQVRIAWMRGCTPNNRIILLML